MLQLEDSQALAGVASLLADPTRAEMLVVMMDGRAFPVSELASYVHVAVPTASHHLAKLVDGGLVQVVRQGRHRYHRIASEPVASLIEALAVATPRLAPTRSQPLRHCRTCYNHLAGEVGVGLRESLESGGLIELAEGLYSLKRASALDRLGLDVGGLVGKACLDWTERVPHIGGPLGSALFRGLMDSGWIERGDVPRQIRLTSIGVRQFWDAFGIGPRKLDAV